MAFATYGLWMGDGRIIVIGRDGKIGAIRRGSTVKFWEKLAAPAVAISTLSTDGTAAVAVMDSTLIGFSKKVQHFYRLIDDIHTITIFPIVLSKFILQGLKIWCVNVPGTILDLVSLPVPQSGLSLLAVSTMGHGVRIYDGKHHVDTMKMMEPVSALKVVHSFKNRMKRIYIYAVILLIMFKNCLKIILLKKKGDHDIS